MLFEPKQVAVKPKRVAVKPVRIALKQKSPVPKQKHLLFFQEQVAVKQNMTAGKEIARLMKSGRFLSGEKPVCRRLARGASDQKLGIKRLPLTFRDGKRGTRQRRPCIAA
ncbi:hypothetical protein GMSM_15640 [Geomonas sp. Red276]